MSLLQKVFLSAIALFLVLSIGPDLSWMQCRAQGRPYLEYYQGRYFGWSAPSGWRHSESTNGVTLSSPDGGQKAMYALLLRSRGSSDPQNFLLWMMSRIPGCKNIKVVAYRKLPDQRSGIPNTRWKVMEMDMSYSDNGVPQTAKMTCGVNNYYGMYDAMIVGYQAAVNTWPAAKLYLPAVARSIKITNTREVAGNNTLIPVRNNPLDNSALIESWKRKGISEARISQARGDDGLRADERPCYGQDS